MVNTLEYVQLFLTFKCNRSCDFCFNMGIHNEATLSSRDFGHIASIVKGYGISEIDILGGEPLLHKEIFEILESATNYFKQIYLSTNGSLINRLKEVKRLYPNISLGISLNSEVNDNLREFIIQNRPVLKSLFQPNKPLSNITWKFIRSGIPYYLIYRDVLSEEDLQHLVPFYEFLKEVEGLKEIYPNIEPLYCKGFISGHRQWRCPAGSTKLSIMPDGSVYPCYLFFGFPEFKLGNILDSDLKRILKNPTLDFFRNFREKECNNIYCNIKDICHGGCPAQSYIVYRDLNKSDPRCNQR